MVDGAIGEPSPFHHTFGVYAQGVSIETAVLPPGWQHRLVVIDTPGSQPGRAVESVPDAFVFSLGPDCSRPMAADCLSVDRPIGARVGPPLWSTLSSVPSIRCVF